MNSDQIVNAVLATLAALLAAGVAIVCVLLAKYRSSQCAKGPEWPAGFWRPLSVTVAAQPESPTLASRINVENAVLETLCSVQTDQTMLNTRRPVTSFQFPGKWRSLPLPGTGRHTFNPAMVDNKWLLMRDENMEDLFGCTCRYLVLPARWSEDPNYAAEILGDPVHLNFVGPQGKPLVSLVRGRASPRKPVVEDLRCVRGTEDRTLLTGVLFLGMGRGVCQGLFELAADGRSARLLRRFPSPSKAKYEKNWLFVQHPDGSFDVLHSVFPSLRVYRATAQPGDPLVLVQEHAVARTREKLPPEWLAVMNNLSGEESPLRLSALLPYSEEEWLLLTHIKYVYPRGYTYVTFALYVSTKDYRPTRYLPCELLTEMGVGIAFAIDGRVTKDRYEIIFGVSDRISGSKSYPRAEWERKVLPWHAP